MRRLQFILSLVLITLAVACQPVARPTGPLAGVTPVAGSAFNQFFPQDEGDYDVVYTQEKEGFAQAQLNQQGSEVATLSIADAANNPDALTKFESSTEEVAGYPAAAVGELGTAILVGERFQVQVRAKAATFDAEQRAAWLEAFDLAGLAGLADE
jgi:hypothetical protein